MIFKRGLIAFAIAISALKFAHADPSIAVGTASGAAGTVVSVPVFFDASLSAVASMQFSLTLPVGVSTASVTAGLATTNAGKAISSSLNGNTWTLIVFGSNPNQISSGTIMNVQMRIAAGTAAGTLSLPISNIVYSGPFGNAVPGGISTGGSITVTTGAPVIISSSPALGVAGMPFGYLLQATNNPTSFSATGLPAGLSINTTSGYISGTSSVVGTSSVTVSATNASGTGTMILLVSINPALPPPPVIVSSRSVTGIVGVVFSYQITAINSPTSFGAMGLPAGLSVNSVTGLISGRPIGVGISSITVSAANAGGIATNLLVLTVGANAPSPLRKANGDYDGDRKTDIAVFRPTDGIWYVKGIVSIAWGNSADILVPGDYDGDGKADEAVFRPSDHYWYVRNGATGAMSTFFWGASTDIPVPGDYDGDGKTDVAVWRPSDGRWYLYGKGSTQWGAPTDIPVPGDYDGDGKTDMAIYRPWEGRWYIMPASGATSYSVAWGSSSDFPVPGDYDGDRKTDFAFFRLSDGTWNIRGVATIPWGNYADIPVPGDYDGDGKTDVAVWRPSDGRWYLYGMGSSQWGTAGDIPVVNSVTTVIQTLRLGGPTRRAAEDFQPIEATSSVFSSVRVYPNPWKSNKHAGQDIIFNDLPSGATIKLFTVSGHWIKTLQSTGVSASWDRTNDSGDHVASGIYLYLITAPSGDKKTGQLTIVK